MEFLYLSDVEFVALIICVILLSGLVQFSNYFSTYLRSINERLKQHFAKLKG